MNDLSGNYFDYQPKVLNHKKWYFYQLEKDK